MPAPARNLTDSVVVVTGAAGGIGAAIARQALESGAKVVLGDLKEAPLRGLQDEWGPERVACVAGDIRDEATSLALIQAGQESFGRVDSVVANAGIGYYGGLLEYGPDQVRLMLDVNVLGTIWLARAAVRHFRQQGSGGDIVIIGSVAGLLMGGGQEAVYAASKAAQINLGYALDRELRAEGIRTTVVAPAGVNTPFAEADGRFRGTKPEEGPFMDPADIAGAVLYTLSQPRRMRTELWTMWSLAEQH